MLANISGAYDENTIQRVIETHLDMIVRIAYQNTASMSDAEDVAQEVFIKFMRASAFCDDYHIKAWLIRVTINLCRDLKKSFWHKKTEPLTEEWPVFSDVHNQVMDEIRRLPLNYRNVIYLYYYEGYTIAETANILGRKENTVSSWLTRAKKRLRILILDGGNEHE